ncbi:testis-expressed protein 26-like isoform X2 [Pseudorasbora parva]|uniref:testis-expressed protein 26-like isoform X2 n=1 Tax=Pseudorasbora parva TaxID=51549 RepID=UPI00351DF4EC
MANYDVNKKWDVYETSHKRDFIYRPISSNPTQIWSKTSGKVYRNAHSLDEPVGATAYSEDFCWKPLSKTACIRSATASGNRRNNPHPNQAFMVWRRTADQVKHIDGSSSLQLPLTEKEIQKALSAQYRSTYRTDFIGLPQGIMKNHATFAPFNLSHAGHYYTQTEMRHNYRPPKSTHELLGNNTRYGCNKLHGIAARGIVPTLIQSHINNPENSKLQTTYNKHFGSRHVDVSSLLKSTPPQTFQLICKKLSDKEKKDVKKLHISSSSSRGSSSTGAFMQTPSTLERMSAWPGPL